jgi:predicted kinase
LEREGIRAGIQQGYSVVVDATNFKCEFIKEIGENCGVEIAIKDFTDVSLEECIARDAFRDKEEQVGEEVIRNMYNKYLKNGTSTSS